MLKRKMVTAALVVAGVFTFFEYTTVAQQNQPATPQNQPAIPRNQSTLTPLDKQFVMDAAQGGMAEVSLGQMATQRATSNAVKQYGQRMVQEHTQANKELMQLASKKGVTPPKDMGPKYKAAMARLSQLPKASFDQAYLNEAGINGHLESQAVFQRQAQLGQDPDLKAFAAKILPTVEKHLQMAREMTGKTVTKDRTGNGNGNQNH